MNDETPTDTSPMTTLTAESMSHFWLITAYGEFLMALGRGQALVPKPGAPLEARADWTHAFSMSPETAKDLCRVLGEMLEDYENKFGTIPSVKPSQTKE